MAARDAACGLADLMPMHAHHNKQMTLSAHRSQKAIVIASGTLPGYRISSAPDHPGGTRGCFSAGHVGAFLDFGEMPCAIATN